MDKISKTDDRLVMRFKRHFFVCQARSAKPDEPACGNRGSAEILATLGQILGSHPDLMSEVAVGPTGCLGHCEDGPTIVVYPEATWYARVGPEDAREIAERHVVGGEPVARLAIADPPKQARPGK